jgi:hypothetical protein
LFDHELHRFNGFLILIRVHPHNPWFVLLIMASAAESPRLFSFRAPAALARAQLEQALRLSAGRQVDHRHPALSLLRLALRPDLSRLAVWSDVY